MKKTIIFLLLFTTLANAQTLQKVDMPATIARLPQAFSSVQDAFKAQTANQIESRFRPFADEMQTLSDKIQQPNPVTERVKQTAINQDAKFKADGVDKMTGSQKIDYAKQQGLGGPDADNRLTFAQKMQDPEYKKRFEAMSPQEKVAVVQQQGLIKPQPATPPSGNPMQADMMAIMQDPAMREKWKNMSQTEKQAFIENYKKSKGYDGSKRPNQAQNNDSQGGFGNMLDDNSATSAKPASTNLADDAFTKSRTLVDAIKSAMDYFQNTADKVKENDENVMADLQVALTALGKTEVAEGIAEAKRQGKTGLNWLLTNPQAEHQLRLQFINKRIAADNDFLMTTTYEWTTRQVNLKVLATDYQAAIVKIKFGETLYSDDSQFQNLAGLASQQAAVFSGIKAN